MAEFFVGSGTMENIFGESISNNRKNSKRNKFKGYCKIVALISPFIIISAAVLMSPLRLSFFTGLGIVLGGGAVVSVIFRCCFPSISKTIQERRRDLMNRAGMIGGELVKKLEKKKNDSSAKANAYQESEENAKKWKKRSLFFTVLFTVSAVAALAFAPVLLWLLLPLACISGTIGLGYLGLEKWRKSRHNKHSTEVTNIENKIEHVKTLINGKKMDRVLAAALLGDKEIIRNFGFDDDLKKLIKKYQDKPDQELFNTINNNYVNDSSIKDKFLPEEKSNLNKQSLVEQSQAQLAALKEAQPAQPQKPEQELQKALLQAQQAQQAQQTLQGNRLSFNSPIRQGDVSGLTNFNPNFKYKIKDKTMGQTQRPNHQKPKDQTRGAKGGAKGGTIKLD